MEVIKVNNQIVLQTAIIVDNLVTWQKNVIKGSMMHETKSYNKNYASLSNQGEEQLFMM